MDFVINNNNILLYFSIYLLLPVDFWVSYYIGKRKYRIISILKSRIVITSGNIIIIKIKMQKPKSLSELDSAKSKAFFIIYLPLNRINL